MDRRAQPGNSEPNYWKDLTHTVGFTMFQVLGAYNYFSSLSHFDIISGSGSWTILLFLYAAFLIRDIVRSRPRKVGSNAQDLSLTLSWPSSLLSTLTWL